LYEAQKNINVRAAERATCAQKSVSAPKFATCTHVCTHGKVVDKNGPFNLGGRDAQVPLNKNQPNITRRMVGGIWYNSWFIIHFASLNISKIFISYQDAYILRKADTQLQRNTAYFELLTQDSWNKAKKPRILQILSLLPETHKMWPVINAELQDISKHVSSKKTWRKWAPPEWHEATVKEIDGRPYHWHEVNSRWYKNNKVNHHGVNEVLPTKSIAVHQPRFKAKTTNHRQHHIHMVTSPAWGELVLL